MFEELDKDLKLIKEYFAETAFAVTADVSWSGDEALDSLKGAEGFACVKKGGPESGHYKNMVCGPDLAGLAVNFADCLIWRNALHSAADPEAFIKACRRSLKAGGYLVISDTVTDAEDAFLNAAEFVRDENHVRFYTVGEITGWAEGLFRLEYYRRVEKVMSLETWKGGSAASSGVLNGMLEKFPEEIKKELNFARDASGELLGFTLKTGLFIFRALPEIG